jgi:hypothetical protein
MSVVHSQTVDPLPRTSPSHFSSFVTLTQPLSGTPFAASPTISSVSRSLAHGAKSCSDQCQLFTLLASSRGAVAPPMIRCDDVSASFAQSLSITSLLSSQSFAATVKASLVTKTDEVVSFLAIEKSRRCSSWEPRARSWLLATSTTAVA